MNAPETSLDALTRERDELRVELKNARDEIATEKAITGRLIEEEREACAKVAETLRNSFEGAEIAAAIRARGGK